MTFEQELIITVIDKVVMALILVGLGFILNWLLEVYRSNQALRQAVAPMRAASYNALWKVTQRAKVSSNGKFSSDDKKKIARELTDWYYQEGNALYLSFDAAQLFFNTRKSLKQESDEAIKTAFSALRTQLKVDCGIYSKRHAKKGLVVDNVVDDERQKAADQV